MKNSSILISCSATDQNSASIVVEVQDNKSNVRRLHLPFSLALTKDPSYKSKDANTVYVKSFNVFVGGAEGQTDVVLLGEESESSQFMKVVPVPHSKFAISISGSSGRWRTASKVGVGLNEKGIHCSYQYR